MTPDLLQYYAHQIGMYRAEEQLKTDPNAALTWRTHHQAAAALRARIGPIYQPYPYANKALVKALFTSIEEHSISRAEFACCLQNVTGRHF